MPAYDIRFATTEDGVGIAYWEIGSGPPLVIIQNLSLNHLEAEWSVPSIASLYAALADRYRVVRLDFRGFGMSDNPFVGVRAPVSGSQIGMSVDHLSLDIAAVVDACGLDRFSLMAMASVGPVGIAYAARHPDSVGALILCDAVAAIPSSFLEPFVRAAQALYRLSDESRAALPVSMWESAMPADEAQHWIALTRKSVDVSLGGNEAVSMAQLEWDATPLLSEVRAPTLILCAQNAEIETLPDARRLATRIPNAQLRTVRGRLAPYAADRGSVLEAIDDLLDPPRRYVAPSASSIRTVVFTDVVGSTEFVRTAGDDAGRAAIRAIEAVVAETASKHRGTVVKNLGDGSLIYFGSNSDALAFAIALQDRVADNPLRIRVGLAAGEPIHEDDDIHGTVVAQASRLCAIGDPGEIVAADSVRQLALGKGFEFDSAGEVDLKGFVEPTPVWTVRR